MSLIGPSSMKAEPLLTETLVALYVPECVNIYHPDTGVRSIDEFVLRVGDLSKRYIINVGEKDEDDDPADKFKGDMLEILAEIFFGAFRADPHVGVHEYRPVPLNEDYGVDATGKNVLGKLVAIQCKFKSNPSTSIEYKDMAKTYAAGRKRHALPLEDDDTIILFTTCNSINRPCKEVFSHQIRVIGRTIIGQRIDGNVAFWEEAEQRVAVTLEKLGILSSNGRANNV